MKTLKIARLTQDGNPVYDCDVFALDGANINCDINITGDFIGGNNVVVTGKICTDGITIFGDEADICDVFAGEGIYLGDEANTVSLFSPDDIVVGDDATLYDVCSYNSVKIGDEAETGDIEVWTGEFELGPNDRTGTIKVGR